MVTIIVAAHGESAPALLKTAGMILGNFENVHPVTFLPGQALKISSKSTPASLRRPRQKKPCFARRPLRW